MALFLHAAGAFRRLNVTLDLLCKTWLVTDTVAGVPERCLEKPGEVLNPISMFSRTG